MSEKLKELIERLELAILNEENAPANYKEIYQTRQEEIVTKLAQYPTHEILTVIENHVTSEEMRIAIRSLLHEYGLQW